MPHASIRPHTMSFFNKTLQFVHQNTSDKINTHFLTGSASFQGPVHELTFSYTLDLKNMLQHQEIVLGLDPKQFRFEVINCMAGQHALPVIFGLFFAAVHFA